MWFVHLKVFRIFKQNSAYSINFDRYLQYVHNSKFENSHLYCTNIVFKLNQNAIFEIVNENKIFLLITYYLRELTFLNMTHD